MRDKQVRQAQFSLQILEQIEHLRLHRDIQGTGRFIAHDQARLERQRAGNCDADAAPENSCG